jgi:hypothetical protein
MKEAASTALLATSSMLVSCLDYFSTLKMDEICSPEMSVDFHRTVLYYIPEDRSLHRNHCENLKSETLVHFKLRDRFRITLELTV